MTQIDLKKRSQSERLLIAYSLLSSVWHDIIQGDVDDSILQTAVYCQTDINRIIWKLNAIRNKESDK